LVADQNIQIYSHTDFWQCLDNDRDYALLHSMCEKNKMTWLF